ncbi:hypothetical protein ABDI30_21690 [Paenibacillus cisolokensis]|uniref:hypothetical protein n=1 Tax=Paenibacillus cisolokensis TaxID=1658519 RepID=UPI003D29F301
MRFRWIRNSSRTGCISATVTRSLLKHVDIEIALDMSLSHFAVNPESISQLERKRLLKEAKAELKKIEETRRGGTSRRRMRG